MEKKEYIEPEIEVIAIEVESAMLSGSDFTPESGNDYDGGDAGSTGRRGEWGNLWAETK